MNFGYRRSLYRRLGPLPVGDEPPAALANVNVINSSLRQALTPDTLRGRMNASVRTLVYGALPLGGLAAGILADTIGLYAALCVGAIGYAMSIVPIVLSPIPRLKTIPIALPERH